MSLEKRVVINDDAASVELRLLCQKLMEAVTYGNSEIAKSVFHSDATITGQMDGILVRASVEEYMNWCRRANAKRRGIGDRYQITALRSSGPIAMFEIEDVVTGLRTTSYNTASKVNGAWRINNRTLHCAAQ